MPIQGKNAAKHTVVYAVHGSAVGTTRNRRGGSYPAAGRAAEILRAAVHGRERWVADSLDDAKAAFRAAGDRQ